MKQQSHLQKGIAKGTSKTLQKDAKGNCKRREKERERETEICGALILYQNHRHFHGENSDGFADNLP